MKSEGQSVPSCGKSARVLLGRVPQKMPGTKLEISVQKGAVLAAATVLLNTKYSCSYGQMKSPQPCEGLLKIGITTHTLSHSIAVHIDHVRADKN